MPNSRKPTRYKHYAPANAKILAAAAHATLFCALQTLRRTTAFEPEEQAIYEDMFSAAEALLDNTLPSKLIPEAVEHLLRTGCSPIDTEAAWDVALHTARLVLVAVVFDRQKSETPFPHLGQ